jgi:protein phosphatase
MSDAPHHPLPEAILKPPIMLSISKLHHLQNGPAYGMTDVGHVRKANEDNFLIDETLNLLMVADGMGGHASGAEASATTLTAMHEFLLQAHERLNTGQPDDTLERPFNDINAIPDPDATCSNRHLMAASLLFDAVAYANQLVYAHNLAKQRPEGGMGTTLTGCWRSPFAREVVFFHVGDSRLYRHRRGQLQQMTRALPASA